MGNQLPHAAEATSWSDPTGCATPTDEVTWKHHKAGLLRVSRSDHAVMLCYCSSPEIVHCREELTHTPEMNKGNSGVLLPCTAGTQLLSVICCLSEELPALVS